MKLSQAQFDGLDENSIQTFLDKQLWIKENYEVCYSAFHQFLSSFLLAFLMPLLKVVFILSCHQITDDMVNTPLTLLYKVGIKWAAEQRDRAASAVCVAMVTGPWSNQGSVSGSSNYRIFEKELMIVYAAQLYNTVKMF